MGSCMSRRESEEKQEHSQQKHDSEQKQDSEQSNDSSQDPESRLSVDGIFTLFTYRFFEYL